MAGAKLNEADASRLARHYGKSVSEMAAVVGQDAEVAATRLGLSPDDLTAALKESALGEARDRDAEESRRAAARRDGTIPAGANQVETADPVATAETLSDGTPLEQADAKARQADRERERATAKKTAAKRTTKKTAAKKTAAKKAAAKKTTAKKATAKKAAKRSR